MLRIQSQSEHQCSTVCQRRLSPAGLTYEATVRPRLPRRPRPHVLVIEYRDEVYATLHRVLEELGCKVHRAESSEIVAIVANHSQSDLILLNQEMPNESGWLIACKLRVTRHWQPVWMYTAQQSTPKADWQRIAGLDEVVDYGGDLTALVECIRRGIARWLGKPPVESPPLAGIARTALVA